MVLPDTSAVHDKNDSGQLPQVSKEQGERERERVRVCFEWRGEVLLDSCGESLQPTMRKTH